MFGCDVGEREKEGGKREGMCGRLIVWIVGKEDIEVDTVTRKVGGEVVVAKDTALQLRDECFRFTLVDGVWFFGLGRQGEKGLQIYVRLVYSTINRIRSTGHGFIRTCGSIGRE